MEDGGWGMEDGEWRMKEKRLKKQAGGLHSAFTANPENLNNPRFSHPPLAAPDIGLRFSVQQNGEIRIEDVVKGSPAHMALQPPRSVSLQRKRTTMRFDPFTGETSPSVAG
jgi:hypothetical protein